MRRTGGVFSAATIVSPARLSHGEESLASETIQPTIWLPSGIVNAYDVITGLAVWYNKPKLTTSAVIDL